MTANTEIWDKLKRVPPEHLKGFQRAGGFKGTAIKPMWTIHRMTEVYGPVGKAWGIDPPSFQTVTAGDEILVYCTVGVWVGREAEGRFYGVGGDKVRAMFGSGPRNDDEAFKKAYTDALTNALKMLGAGADVHMGLWNGSKYIDETSDPPPVMVSVAGTAGASKVAARPEYDALVKAIRNAASVNALKDWYQANVRAIDEMPPNFVDELRVEYNDRLSELKRGLAA